MPVGDLVEHEPGPSCVCGPADVPVPLADGGMGWLLVHQALDGRE
jgi:hypothetical protein